MSDYIIATSSTCDLPREYLDNHGIPFIPYSFTVNDQPQEDDCREENRAAIFAGMRAGDDLKTSMINEFAYYEFFKSLLEQGKDLIFLDMSVKMSVSYENAQRAAESIRAQFPARRFTVMDTRCISGGLGLLVKEMARRREQGMSYDEVLAWGEANKLKIAHRFTVDDLKYLKRGGRVSNASALVGSLLSIKPVLYVPDAGTLDVVKKARGRKAALCSIRDGILSDLHEINAVGQELLLLHADCLEDAQWVAGQVSAAHPELTIHFSSLGVVIGAHTGPGLLTAFYLCEKRVP